MNKKYREPGDEVFFSGHTLWAECSGIAIYSGQVRISYLLSRQARSQLSIWNKAREAIYPKRKIHGFERVQLEFPESRIPLATIGQMETIGSVVRDHNSLDEIASDPRITRALEITFEEFGEGEIYDSLIQCDPEATGLAPWVSLNGGDYNPSGLPEDYEIWDVDRFDFDYHREEWKCQSEYQNQQGRENEPYKAPSKEDYDYEVTRQYLDRGTNVLNTACWNEFWIDYPIQMFLSGGEYEQYPSFGGILPNTESIVFYLGPIDDYSRFKLSLKELATIFSQPE